LISSKILDLIWNMKKTLRGNAWFFVAVFSVLVAIGLHIYLNKHHIELKLGATGENSVCNVSEVLNCDTVATSKYAEVFGLPIALLGVLGNAFLLILLGLARLRWTEDSEQVERYSFYFSGFIFLVSLLMGSISLFILKSGCPFCMGTYAASLVTLISVWGAFRPNLKLFGDDLRDLFTERKWLPGTLVSLILLGALVYSMILDSYGFQQIREARDSSLTEWLSSPALNFDQEAGLSYQKTPGPTKVVVVEFADFLCSHCREAYHPLHAFARAHNDVKFIYKPFPLDGVCNTAVTAKGDGKRCDLAYAALCAEKVGQKGWETHHYIFDNQETIFSTPMAEVTENICKKTGVDCTQLKTCMNSDEVHEIVKRSAAEGEKAQIGGTPSIFFNNRLLRGGQLLPILEHIYKNSGN
jgi:protein-disulfide isomerase/uncharacterized membrane protein